MGNQEKKILIVDSQPNTVIGLKKGLTDAGYTVYYAKDGNKALEFIKLTHPDLILSDVNLKQMDGHRLLKTLRSNADTKRIPFVFLSAQKHVDDRIKSISIGADDYIVKPYYLDEVLVRIEMLLKEVEKNETKLKNENHRFFGNLSEMNLIDLIKTLEIGKKSGILKLKRNGTEGQVSIQSGDVINAVLDNYKPEQALAKMFTWTEGQFYVDFREVNSPRIISFNNETLIAEGQKKLSQWQKIKAQLPPLNSILTIKPQLTENDLKDLTINEKKIIEISKGDMPIWDLIEESQLDDIHALEIVKKMYLKGVLREFSAPRQAENLISNTIQEVKSKDKMPKTSPERILSIISSLFKKLDKEQTLAEIGSLKQDVQEGGNRRNDEFDDTSSTKMKTQIYLTKGELMMIREKLL